MRANQKPVSVQSPNMQEVGYEMKKKKKGRIIDRNPRPFGLLFLLVLFAMTGIFGSRRVLLKNADYMGQNLVQSYALDEKLNIGIYENMIEIGMAYIHDQAAEGKSREYIEEWIASYFEKIKVTMNGNIADSYAVVDGKVIAASPWEDIQNYDYNNVPWYRQAMEAKGKVIFTDAYEDLIYHRQVVTIAAADPDTGNAVAVDLYSENFQKNHQDLQLLEGSSYYVCDSAGKVLYQRASFDVPEEAVAVYVEELYRKIDSGEMEDGHRTITDLDGKKRGIYYYRAPNGWLCILTIPLEALYENLYDVYINYAVIAIVLFAIMAFVWIREKRLKKYIQDKNDTIQVLGNSYYAIYRINLEENTYEMIKGSEYVRQRLPYSGSYEDLLEVLVECINEETRKEFAESFSLKNILSLTEKRIVDFGGDFLRIFGDVHKWVNVRLVQDPQHSPGKAVLCFRETEEEKQRQLQNIRLLEEALMAADASEKSQKQFFSSMSHDMRTPLNVIIGMAELGLREDCTREKRMDYLRKISVSSRQLLTLINDILEMSRLEQGKIDLENSTFNLCDTLELCVSPFEIQAGNEGKHFKMETNVYSPVVCGDPLRLTQILNNLLSNAVKFTENGDSISVTLSQVKRGRHGRYLFVIEDTGLGMSKEFLPRLFEPYERERRFGTQNVAGTGLGMPIVKNLVSQMGGEITVDSELGRGTRFSVMLPFSVSSAENVPEKQETDFGKLEGRRILLAEDNPLNMEIVSEFLGMKGMEVSTAENGREALEKFSESEVFFFDAILMDMQMPEMDGCAATERIRALERADAGTVPIIALTANAFPEDIARTAAAGMNVHLSKPIEPNILWATLLQMICGE